MGINPKDFRQMKHNLFAILGAATLLLTAKIHVIQAAPMPLTIQHSTAKTPVLLSQAVNQDAGSDRTQTKESGASIPSVLGLLGILLVAAGIVFWSVRGSAKNQRGKDVRQQIKEKRQAPIAGQQGEGELNQDIVAPLEDVSPIPVPTKQVPDLWEAPISNPTLLDILTKIDTLQQEINAAKQKFEKIGNRLEREVKAQIQFLPDSIFTQSSPERLLKQQQALTKLENFQELTYDLKLPNEGYFKMGNALFDDRRLEEAIASYDKAIELDPDAVFAWFNTACIYSLQGDVARSVRYLAQAIHLDPTCSARAQKHAEFDPVRNDERFKQLLQDGERSRLGH
ncbi:MAG: tetratricopeptide repeat protein [Acaryochloridaceae cyanobacterium RU_4_10]|nr:tetratricopeptide repeat protein [Acaryochloridaceae cyanobacterium RU_4_10]